MAFKKSAPVIWSAGTLENIGKLPYEKVAAAYSATGGRGVRQKKPGGKQ
jgi:hypothetical protein